MRVLINMYNLLKQFLVDNNFALQNEGIISHSVSLIVLSHKNKRNSLYIVLENWQFYLQKTYAFIIFILIKNIDNIRNQQLFALLYSIFIGILFLKFFGLSTNSFLLF